MEATQNKKGITMASINLKCSDGYMIVKKIPKTGIYFSDIPIITVIFMSVRR